MIFGTEWCANSFERGFKIRFLLFQYLSSFVIYIFCRELNIFIKRINNVKKLCNRFPKNWRKRELKKVLEDYWAKKVDFSEVKYVAEKFEKKDTGLIKKRAKIDFIASNDFSLYDNMLDSYYFIRSNSKKISTPKR